LVSQKGTSYQPSIADFVRDAGFQTVEDFPHFRDAIQMNIIVTGGSNNNYYSKGGLKYEEAYICYSNYSTLPGIFLLLSGTKQPRSGGAG
jgi:hypothetical protein